MLKWLLRKGNRKFDIETVDDAAAMLPKLRLQLKDNPDLIPYLAQAVLEASNLLQQRFQLPTRADAVRLVRVEPGYLLGAAKDMDAAIERFSGNPTLINSPTGRSMAVAYWMFASLARLRVVAAVGEVDLRSPARAHAERISTVLSMVVEYGMGRAMESDVLSADW